MDLHPAGERKPVRGVKEKMPVSRQKELSVLILTEYPFLKASEMLLFFHRLKCGRYGRFYGSVDALTITTSLLQFMDERRKESVRYRQPDTAAPAITTPPRVVSRMKSI